MIQLGRIGASIYPNNGIMWENRGMVVFEGSAFIGNNSYVSIGSKANVFFGDCFVARASLKLVSYHCVKFFQCCTIGWECMIMDTDFHSIKLLSGGKSKGYGTIVIGSHTWIANNSILLKNAVIPDYSVIAARSLICKSCERYPSYSIIGNSFDTEILSSGWMDRSDNKIDYID